MQKRNDIIQAAERLFYDNGFHATSTDRICREAGVSTRTLYRHFPSREQLTEAVMQARQQRFFADLREPGDPLAIHTLFTVLGDWMEAYGTGGCFFLKAWGEYAQESVRLSALALDFRYQLRAYITACVHDVALADAIWMLFEGAITSALIVGAQAAQRAGDAAALLMARQEAR
ncbi:TetR/AcrR family transcriptional regulator [Kosakonia sp. CCTCC M2018092]|uniref:TetR/AcrR family transcriptional regulator n=1 Tax=Kosakonia sp. CCTCC M2018092 TaxID=2492396 RepID=UPI000F60694A|nr:TetR/AcrR family transcriptional regulator [Kosakonia sp. CCTCC M2018092]AZI89082.1 TetR/AcrR family transcriptional regulator [Kosakonia sp. CCTCC M2018092]